MENDFVMIIEYDIDSCYDNDHEMYFVELEHDNLKDFISNFNRISSSYKRYTCYLKQLSTGLIKELSNDWIYEFAKEI